MCLPAFLLRFIEDATMTRIETIKRLQQCVQVAEQSPPLSDSERAEHLSRCACEQARAEARRSSSPQPDLLGAV
ncbi:MAG TPA: hypothetical protein DEB32_10860 [Stenotrophomonas sp.]|nr:hypothetical protein [Stenotrophomonas sp.]